MRLLFNRLIAALLVVVVICYFLFVGHDMKFHALVETKVVKNVDDISHVTEENTLGIIGAGETVQIVGCEDIKTDWIYLVELKDGQRGYAVSSGRYEITRKPKSIIRGGVDCW